MSINSELRELCASIVDANRSVGEWREREADDEFQTAHYCAGFDATEGAFTFSRYDDHGGEWWFQLSEPEVRAVAAGKDVQLIERPADT